METIKSLICGRELYIFSDAIVRRSSETEDRAAVSTALWHSVFALFAYNPPFDFYEVPLLRRRIDPMLKLGPNCISISLKQRFILNLSDVEDGMPKHIPQNRN